MENKSYDHEKCPEHNKVGVFIPIPPPKEDKKRRKLIVTFQCPEGHTFVKEFGLN